MASLATQFKANITIVHADYLYSYGQTRKIPGIDDYRHRIDRLLSRSHAYFTKRGIKAKSYVNGSDKSVVDAIIDAARRERVDLIVVSAKAGPLLALLAQDNSNVSDLYLYRLHLWLISYRRSFVIGLHCLRSNFLTQTENSLKMCCHIVIGNVH